MKRPLSLALALGILPASLSAADPVPEPKQLADVVSKWSPAIVSVKAVAKVKSEDGSFEEMTIECQGAIVDPSGLVMGSLKGYGKEIGSTVELTDIKVVVEGKDEPCTAFLVAKDSNLDLGFLQIEGLGENRLPCVAFEKAATASVGQTVVAVTRFGEGYGYAAHLAKTTVTGRIEKPQPAYSLQDGVAEGLPLFTLGGEFLGIYVPIAPATSRESDEGNSISFGGLRIQLGGRDNGDSFLLPAESFKRLITEARKSAAQLCEERAKEPGTKE